MKVVHVDDVPAETIEQGAEGTTIRWLISKDDGAPNFAMRMFEIQPGGSTFHHEHEWEHEIYVASGGGVVRTPEGDIPIRKGSVVYVAPHDEHQFCNTGEAPMRMVCLIPHPEQ